MNPRACYSMIKRQKSNENKLKTAFFQPFIEMLVAFLLFGKVPVDCVETLMIMDILGAGEKARKQPGEWVSVKGYA